MLKVGVIGAGVIGLSSAINIMDTIPNASVTIIADQFGRETVSYGAGGLYRPDLTKLVLEDNSNREVMTQCLRDSWHHFSKLAMSTESVASGNMLTPGLMGHRKNMDEGYSIMKELTFNFRQLTPQERKRMGYPDEFKHMYTCISVVSQGNVYMDWLLKTYLSKGGKTIRRTVDKLEELYGEYDIVVNCCGLRAKTFLSDSECFPTRGQLVLVKAPWFKFFNYLDTDVYVIPHMDKVLVGGVRIHGDADTSVKPEVTQRILRNAEAIFPQLKGAEIIGEWANSRPGRTSIRLETEMIKIGHNKSLPVVHNYGHGGNGITLSWGTAVQAAKLVKQQLLTSKQHASKL